MTLSTREFENLTKSIDWSIKKVEKPRQERVDAIRQLVGIHYSDDGSERTVPVNMLKLAIQIYVRSLAARSPRALVTTKNPSLKSTAASLQLAVNEIPKEIQLTETLRRVVTEALFLLGVLKTGLHQVGTLLGHEYGEPFVDVVTPDDYFVDMSAQQRDQIQYEGNDYWLTQRELKKTGWLSKEELGRLEDGNGAVGGIEESLVGNNGQERADAIGSGGGTSVPFRRRHRLRDVWLPQDGLLVTYAVETKKKLNELEWDGPKGGPYLSLGFSEVPGNLLPLAPVAVWRDLHDLSNAIFRKLGRQADDQKSVLGFGTTDEEGVTNFKNAKDGEGIRYTGGKAETLTAGGVDPRTLTFYMQCRDLFSYFAGNLDALGGLAPQTETLGQDKLLTEAAGAQLRDMQGQTIEMCRELFRRLAWYEWNDPVKERTLEKAIPGIPEMSIPVAWNRDSKQGDFDEFQLDIDVYSALDDSPSLKLQRLGYIMQSYVLPLMPEIQRQGGSLDVQRLLTTVATLADFDELKDIVTFATLDDSQQPGQQAPGKPAETKRTYEHTSKPRPQSSAGEDALAQLLAEGGGQAL